MYSFTNPISKCLLFSGIAFLFGCADIPDELRDEAGRKCGGRAYTEYQFCANGQVYDFCGGTPYNPSSVACCNNRQYTLSAEFCSGLYVYPKCDGKEYDPSDKRCQGNIIVTKCGIGSYYYNPSTEFCSGNNVYSKCNGYTYDPSDERCESNIVVTMCGVGYYYYNPSTQFCSSNNVYSKCNGYTYDPSNQRCESGIVVTKCGTGSYYYNPSTQFCSGNSVYSKCDGYTYDPSNQKCQGDVVVTRCGTGSNYYNPATQFCSGSSIYSKCNGQSYTPTSQRCENNVVETKCGSGWYDAANENLRCQDNVVQAKCGSDWYNSANQRCENNVIETGCGTGWYVAGSMDYCSNNTIKTYRTVKIGTQTWMAENLNYNASGSKCYNNVETNCAVYGRLYNWATAMANSASSSANPSGVQGICPTGWHLPSSAEWDALMIAVGGSSTAGTKLKATSGWNGGGNGTDDYGFSALPGGFGYSIGLFSNVGDYGYWWSSTESSASYAYSRGMNCYDAYVYSLDYDKTLFYSVRCVQDY